jgi:histone-lysine N-methyltransferase SETMAR
VLGSSPTQAVLREFGWEVFEHPAYSPELAPSDFHLFPKLKEFFGGRRFKSGEEVKKDAVKEWLNGLAAEVYDEGIQKLVTRCDKCLNVGGDYVE